MEVESVPENWKKKPIAALCKGEKICILKRSSLQSVFGMLHGRILTERTNKQTKVRARKENRVFRKREKGF